MCLISNGMTVDGDHLSEGTPNGIRTRDLHLERVMSLAARRWGPGVFTGQGLTLAVSEPPQLYHIRQRFASPNNASPQSRSIP